MTTYPRSLWVKALTAHSVTTICNLATEIVQPWQIKHKILPQNGLSLLTMQDAVFHEPYYLGEIPVSNAHLSLIDQEGNKYEGAAQVMSDSEDLAIALAICDAVMENQLQGWKKVAHLIDSGIEKRQETNQIRGVMLTRTKVNFSLLSQEEEDAED